MDISINVSTYPFKMDDDTLTLIITASFLGTCLICFGMWYIFLPRS